MPVTRSSIEWGDVHHGATYQTYIERVLGRDAARNGLTLPLPSSGETNAQAKRAPAFIAQGKVLAQCPECQHEFQMVFRDAPLFMCTVCWNADAGGLYRLVGVPEDMEEVATVMAQLRDPRRLNWIPEGSDLAGSMGDEPEQSVGEILAELDARIEYECGL